MTVWLNVSFTAQWVGPVVGIARTERRIAEGGCVIFCGRLVQG